MKIKGLIVLGITALLFSSCDKEPPHEVIPAPIPTVDLNAHFIGEINGAVLELTENVFGYTNTSTKDQIILNFPDLSSAAYFSKMSSTAVLTSVKIGLGSVTWNANIAPHPSISVFNDFVLTSMNPLYSNNGANGFEVTYTDASNREWISNELDPNLPGVEFKDIIQDSDESGDYSLFTCEFDCYAYSLNPDSLAVLPVPVVHLDSISIQNAIYRGWFKR